MSKIITIKYKNSSSNVLDSLYPRTKISAVEGLETKLDSIEGTILALPSSFHIVASTGKYTDLIDRPDDNIALGVAAHAWGDHKNKYRLANWVPSWSDISGNIPVWNQNTTGTADKAVALSSAKTITVGNQERTFDGTENIAFSIDQMLGTTNKLGFLTISGGTISVNSGLADEVSKGVAAYGWGNHAGKYRPVSWVPDWNDVENKPTFHSVATSGSYSSLSGKPTTDIALGVAAHAWGDHTGKYRPISWTPTIDEVISKGKEVTFKGTAGTDRIYLDFQGVSANDATNQGGGAFVRFRTSTSDGYGGLIGSRRLASGRSNLVFKTGGQNPSPTMILDDNGNLNVVGNINIAPGKNFKINNANLKASDIGAEPTIGTKGSAFNKNFAGTGSATTVAKSDHTHSPATITTAGFMSAADKTKLDALFDLLNSQDEEAVDTLEEILEVFSKYPQGIDIMTKFAEKANDNEVVKLTGNQSIAGNKTFTGDLLGSGSLVAASEMAIGYNGTNESRRRHKFKYNGNTGFLELWRYANTNQWILSTTFPNRNTGSGGLIVEGEKVATENFVTSKNYLTYSGNISTADALLNPRTITIGKTGNKFNGTKNINYTLDQVLGFSGTTNGLLHRTGLNTYSLNTTVVSNASLGSTAHGWGNHNTQGYLKSDDIANFITKDVTNLTNYFNKTTIQNSYVSLNSDQILLGRTGFDKQVTVAYTYPDFALILEHTSGNVGIRNSGGKLHVANLGGAIETSKAVVLDDDPRLTDSREPKSHTHTYAQLTGTIPTWNQNTAGNAATATTLKTTRTITVGKKSNTFNGGENINYDIDQILGLGSSPNGYLIKSGANSYSVITGLEDEVSKGVAAYSWGDHRNSGYASSSAIPTKTSQLSNDSNFLTAHQSLSNYVTRNTAQTITAAKTFDSTSITLYSRRRNDNAGIYAGLMMERDTVSSSTQAPATYGIGAYFKAKSRSTGAMTHAGLFGGRLVPKATGDTADNIGEVVFSPAWNNVDPYQRADLRIRATGASTADVHLRGDFYANATDTGKTGNKLATEAFVTGKGYLTSASNLDSSKLTGTIAIERLGGGSGTSFLRKDGTWTSTPNTTYSVITTANLETGTETTGRLVSAVRLRENFFLKSEINTMLTGYVVKDGSKVLSTNDFTTAYKTKLDNLKTVATSGSYNDLSNTPYIPINTGDLTNNSGFITSTALNGYAKVASETFTGTTTVGGMHIVQRTKNLLGTSTGMTAFENRKVWFQEGALFYGTALSAGLLTRGISGIKTDGTAKDNLYINYDGDNTYRSRRQLVLQAGSVGTHYGNSLYQYAAARGDAVKGWVEAQKYLKSYTETDPTVESWAKTANASIKIPVAKLDVGTGSSQVAKGNHTHSAATVSAAGFMSAADKKNLDTIHGLWGQGGTTYVDRIEEILAAFERFEEGSNIFDLFAEKAPKASPTFTGTVTMGTNQLLVDTVTLDGTTTAALQIKNANGYIGITPLNSSWAHIYTDRARFIFNKEVATTANTFRSYNNDLLLKRAAVTKLTLGATKATFADDVYVGTSKLATESFVNTKGYATQSWVTDSAEVYDSKRLGAQLPSYYLNASNINQGTLAKERLHADVILEGDSRLTDTRTPKAHDHGRVSSLGQLKAEEISHTQINGLAAFQYDPTTTFRDLKFITKATLGSFLGLGSAASTSADSYLKTNDVSAWAKKSSLDFDDIPTGTSSSTVAIGNHTHSQYLTSLAGAVLTTANQEIEGLKTFTGTTTTAQRLIAVNSNTETHGVVSKGRRANMLYHNTGVTGSLASSLIDIDITNGNDQTERVGKVGIYAHGTGGTDGAPIARYIWFSAVTGNQHNISPTLKIDNLDRVGIAISGTGRPTQALDVAGKIRMRTQTATSDGDDIVATKGYVDSKEVILPTNLIKQDSWDPNTKTLTIEVLT